MHQLIPEILKESKIISVSVKILLLIVLLGFIVQTFDWPALI